MANTPRAQASDDEADVKLVTLELSVEPRLVEYILDLKKLQGFGNTKSAIGRNLLWAEINRLIEANRLKQR